ncbi:protein kinase [Lentinula edodes]|uniref:Protein kinase n=1 Tax=Lentinula edodes TaxID=5353 RepID=A0A1Q3EAH8_LENED|nr:protein kinase [Lentinula edodes]
MEPLPQNPLPDPAPLPQTPKTKQANGPPVVESTPTNDIGDSVVLSLDDFATLILELPVDWKVKEEIALQLDSDAVKDAFEAYLSVAIGVAEAEGKKRKGAAGHETQLYRPLANLLNVLKDSDGEGRLGSDIDEKIFYVQDPRPVLGSPIERKPDLGVSRKIKDQGREVIERNFEAVANIIFEELVDDRGTLGNFVLSVAGNPLPDPAPLPQTPKTKQANGPPVVESTPTSKKYASHAEDEVPQRASVVNKFLEDDIGDSVVLSLDDFATLILELPVDWKVKEEIALQLDSDAVKDAFEAYLSVAIGVAEAEGKKRKGAAGHETQLYRPLANLLNVLKDSDGEGRLGSDIDEKIFYVQDPRPVLGSPIERKPDLGGIYIQLLNLSEDQELSNYLEKKKKIVASVKQRVPKHQGMDHRSRR